MKMYVRIEATAKDRFTASVLGWPEIQTQGATADEALSHLRVLLIAQLQQTQLIPLEIQPDLVENPWLTLGDRLQHNPLLLEVAQSIAAHRQELDIHSEAA